MPLFGAQTIPTAAYPGDSVTVINAEKLLINQFSERIALPPNQGGNGNTLSVELFFAAAPGAYEFDLYVGDTDNSNAFVQEGAAISGAPNAAGYFRAEFNNVAAKEACLFCKAVNANNVNVTAKISVKS
jgi:hypothetical protein